MTKINKDFLRTRETPVDFFRLRALQLAPTIGFDSSIALEAVSIVVTAFGEEWLNAAASDAPPSAAMPFRRHPLGDIISTAGEHQIAELIELAAYLRLVYDVPRVQLIIEGLRAQYYQTLLQLAFTAKLRIAGATDVEIEPPAAAGRASDIRCSFEGTALRVECYRPTVKRDGSQDEATRLAQGILEALPATPIVLAIGIAFNGPITAAARKEVRGIVLQLSNEIISTVARDSSVLPAFSASGELGEVSVCRGPIAKPGERPLLLVAPDFSKTKQDYDLFVRANVAYESEVAGLRGDVRAGIALHSIGIWLCDETRAKRSLQQELQGPLERLGNRIEAKLAQARSETGDARLIIASTWMADQLHRVSQATIERLRKKIVVGHDHMAGLLLVAPSWDAALGRHRYTIHPLLPDIGDASTVELVRRLAALDGHPRDIERT